MSVNAFNFRLFHCAQKNLESASMAMPMQDLAETRVGHPRTDAHSGIQR
jgi:hypothetical protein